MFSLKWVTANVPPPFQPGKPLYLTLPCIYCLPTLNFFSAKRTTRMNRKLAFLPSYRFVKSILMSLSVSCSLMKYSNQHAILFWHSACIAMRFFPFILLCRSCTRKNGKVAGASPFTQCHFPMIYCAHFLGEEEGGKGAQLASIYSNGCGDGK